MKRRDFLRRATAGATALSIWPAEAFPNQSAQGESGASSDLWTKIADSLNSSKATIERIEFYGIHVDAERRFSYKVEKHRQHAFIRFVADGHSGWAEANLGYNKDHPNVPLAKRVWRMGWFDNLKGKTPSEALEYLRASRQKHDYRQLEYAEVALLDLAGRLLGRPTLELLELTSRQPIPGVYCILSDQPKVVIQEAERALSQNLTSHLKVKLYGRVDTDLQVVRAARQVIDPDAYLIGDVNYGYRREPAQDGLDEIISPLLRLRDVGLSACEDPAAMSANQWSELQEAVGALDLVPDVPLRPAWKADQQINPRMGEVFNMHPACMGSIIDTVLLGKKIKSWGKRLMVGDSSLVGPACPIWQQIAIGLGADWVEAIEKPQENQIFQECTLRQSPGRSTSGQVILADTLPGFGTELDVEKLRRLAFEFVSV